MPTTFRSYDPDQLLLLPPSLRDWLPEEHLAYFISDTVDALDLSAFYEPYEGDGRRNQPFEPRMMVKVLLYGYATGVYSSRKIARRLQEDVAFRVLAAGNMPAHRTIAEFRQRHLKVFQELFVQVVRVAVEAGVLKVGRVGVDGTKVRANASKRKAMSYGRMKKEEDRLRKEIEELTERAAREDAEEDELYGPDKRGDELPEELRRREDRLKKIREAKERLEQRQREEDRKKGRREGDGRKSPKGGRKFKREYGEPEEKAQENFTDPDSRIMKTSSEGYQQCYNAQAAVDGESQLIVAAGVTQSAADQAELLGMVDKVESVTGRKVKQLLADAGYRSEENLRELERREIDGYVAVGREGKKGDGKVKGAATRRMAEKLKSEAGQAIYRLRKAIPEPVFGWIKEVLGFRRFSLRGHEKVSGEWDLVCLAANIKRLSTLLVWG